MDRVRLLEVFARVAELKSFTKAADSLGLAKASVSSQVQRLENEIGARLLQRTTRQVALTQDGIAFYERAKDLLSDIDELQTMFETRPTEVSGRVRVDMASRMARFVIIPRLPEFAKTYPNIEIEFGSSDREVDLIREGYDFVIRGGALRDSSLIAKKLGEVRSINAASPLYLKEHGTPKSAQDLGGHYLIRYASAFGGKNDDFEYREASKRVAVKMRSWITVNNAEAYVAACEAGLGIIQSPGSTLYGLLKERRLIEILPRLKIEPMALNIVYPHRRNMSRRVRVFMDWVEKVVSEAGIAR